MNARLITLADPKVTEVLSGKELSQMTNHMLVYLSTKSCQRIEVFGHMTREEFFMGMQQPKVYWPWVPSTDDKDSQDCVKIDDKIGFKIDRY